MSLSELQERYRLATEVVARSRWQIIWLLATPKPVKEVAAEWCLVVSTRREQVQALTCYNWWPLLSA